MKQDLFETPESLPPQVQAVIEKYGECETYEDCRKMLKALKPLGYTFDYYVDANPYDLRKIN